MSVVVPFLGTAAEAVAVVRSLSALTLRAGDEVLLADNAAAGTAWPELPPGVRVVPAPRVRSSYHARNEAAARAAGDWILFMDADCRPAPALLDDYLATPPPASAGLLAGEVDPVAGDNGIVARWLVARRHLAVAPQLQRGQGRVAGTASLMVRREAWEALGGFAEVRSGADYDLCLRAAGAGWELAYRPEARVAHVHAGGLREALARACRYGAGQAWLDHRRPGVVRRPSTLRALARAAGGGAWWTLTARFERGAFKAIDGAWEAAFAWGWHRGSNEA